MATFQGSPVVSSFPDQNILFNSASGITAQGLRTNELLNQGRELDLSNANMEQVGRASAGLLLAYHDEASRAAAYPRVVGMLQSQGFAKNAPAQYPGEATLQMLAMQGVPSADLYKQQLGAKALDAVYPGPSASTVPAGGGTGTTATAGTPAAPGPIEPSAQARATAVRDGLIKRGMDADTATAFAANALHESAANPNTGPGDGGVSQGLFMWNGPRNTEYQRIYGHTPQGAALDEQLDFVMHELNGPESLARDRINQAQGVDGKAAQVSEAYLRPKDTGPEMQRRSATALQLQRQLGGGTQTATAPAGGGGTPGRVQVASVTPATATDGTTAPPAAVPAPLPHAEAVVQARATGQAVPVANTQGMWALPNGNLTSTPPPPATPAAAAPSATTAPVATAAQPAALPALPPDQLTPQDHAELVRYKAALAASGRPDAPVLLQAEIDRRRTANVAAQHQALEEQRQTASDARAAEQLALSKKADARAEAEAKRAGLPTGYRLDDTGKAYRIDGLPPDPAVLEAQANAGKQAQRQFEQENTLRDEFQKLTSDFRIVQTSFENIRSAAKANDGAGDMSLLYNYVRLLDPTSVVRESEFAAAAASGSLGERVQTAYERIASGARMPESLRQSFIREGRNLYNNQLNSHNTVADQYEQLARDNGLEPKRVVTRFARPQDDAQPPPPDLSKKPPGFDKKVQ